MKQKSYLAEGIRVTEALINDIIFLCESRIKETYFTRVGNNKMKFESLIYGKSKSMIRWNDKKRIRHFELIEYIKNDYYNETIDFVRLIKEKLTDGKIEELINLYPDEIITSKIKTILIIFLIERKNRILDIYFQEGGNVNE